VTHWGSATACFSEASLEWAVLKGRYKMFLLSPKFLSLKFDLLSLLAGPFFHASMLLPVRSVTLFWDEALLHLFTGSLIHANGNVRFTQGCMVWTTSELPVLLIVRSLTIWSFSFAGNGRVNWPAAPESPPLWTKPTKDDPTHHLGADPRLRCRPPSRHA